ncbi:hypothetical protein FWH58_00270 [Candidatus Saccharibacteria bacterium]|nr:hypothetical protein [Candidatus Saccharibacteria bacterium]
MSKFNDDKLKSHSSVNIYKRRYSARVKLLIAIMVFAFSFSVSSVYALSTGWLTMTGLAARTEIIQAIFSSANLVGAPRAGETVTISSADADRVINASLLLAGPGDSRTIQFKITNTGNQAIRLLNLSPYVESSGTGLTVQWPDDIGGTPNLTNYVITPGTTSDTFSIIVGWDVSATNVDTGLFRNFSMTFSFQNASLPYGP